MNRFADYALVALGSAAGGVLRHWLSLLVAARWGDRFPWSTLIVNVSGSLVIGLLVGLAAAEGKVWLTPSLRLLVLVGFLGGYTTFSSFSLQTLNLVREGAWAHASWNIAASIIGCLLAVGVGFIAGARLAR